MRAAWIAVLWAAGAAIESATADRSDAVGAVALYGGLGLWVLAVAAMAVPTVAGLTGVRALVPLAPAASVVAWSTGADAVDAALFVGSAAIATVVAFSADVGRAFVQAAAYGDEDRHLLRPPVAYALASVVTWVLWAACTLAGPLLLAARSYLPGVPLTLLALVGAWWAWQRWHRLSRRWLVLVPVGVVVHDHVVLAETLMIRRQELRALRLAPATTEAADMTGPAAGHAIEILTREPVTAILAATPAEPRGKVIHLTGCLVSPTRPGRVLTAAGRRTLPVG